MEKEPNKIERKACPFEKAAEIEYYFDSESKVWGICLREFECYDFACPLSGGEPDKEWQEMEGLTEGGCFLSTACIESKGLSDDCYELNVLREFRDQYLNALPKGDETIRDYYQNAPRIVKQINASINSKQIYSDLYDHLILESIELIRADKKAEALEHYQTIYDKLKKRYLCGRDFDLSNQ